MAKQENCVQRITVRSTSEANYRNSCIPLLQSFPEGSISASNNGRAPHLLTIKDDSIILSQQMLIREEIEMIHQGAGHKEGHGPLERQSKTILLEFLQSKGHENMQANC